ncbi:MAG TPA: patatin family protein [Eggerthellaceae bacterium]|nr:patatin family protein [Eggerthellaceae bacterium]
MIGVVDVGGGERGAYGAGVLDWCMENDVHFDVCVGVSAGAANLSSYLAGQVGRNFAFYTTYSFRPQYMGAGLAVRTREYADLDYIYGTLSNSDGEFPLDYRAMVASGKRFIVVATDAQSALPVYFTMDDMAQDDYAPVKASSALPIVNRPYPVHGRPCFDGGLSDPIPLKRAFDEGCEKVVVILTRPRDFYRDAKNDVRTARLLAPKYPRVAEALANRAGLYNLQLDLAKKYEREGKAIIVAPDSIEGMKTLTKDRSAIEGLYAKGLADARAIASFA